MAEASSIRVWQSQSRQHGDQLPCVTPGEAWAVTLPLALSPSSFTLPIGEVPPMPADSRPAFLGTQIDGGSRARVVRLLG